MPRMTPCLLLSALLVFASGALAKGVYLTVDQFVQTAFDNASPTRSKLWLDAAQRQRLQSVLGHPVGLRVGYWQAHGRSAWVLEEIGKELPITIGIVVERDVLVDVRILEFRESRGGEVRYPFFTKQFIGLSLDTRSGGLTGHIDGISGATLSVDAVTRAAEAALLLAQLAAPPATDPAVARQGGSSVP